MKEFVFTAKDKKQIYCSLWDNVKKPIGVVQIIHGMDEHVKRYDRFAKFLNKNGFIAFGDDHRAHGRTASSIDKIGTPDGNKDLFKAILSDQLEIFNWLQKEYKLPIFLFGHSFGSFITQAFIEKNSNYKAVCLSGSAKFPWFYLQLGKLISWFGIKSKGAYTTAHMIETFSPIRSKKKNESKLTNDIKQINKRNKDKYKSKKFSYGFYYSMFSNLLLLTRKISPRKPMLIISGAKDAVSFNAVLAKSLYKTYKKTNIKKLTLIVYPNDKHELLNEVNYKQVQNDILKFYKSA